MKIDNRDIFEQLGNIFYAVATSQHVKPIEIGELKMLIGEDWLPRTDKMEKSHTSEAAHFILVALDTLLANKTTSQEAYQDFSRFYSLHPEVFTHELKRRILETATRINTLFKAENPLENKSLTALRQLFKEEVISKN